jgi:reverse gyrase
MAMEKSVLADPVAFSESVFGVKLWKTQKLIPRSIFNNRRVVVRAAHSTGKTMGAALLALWYVSRYEEARVVIVAPSWLLVRSVIWSELHGLFASAL